MHETPFVTFWRAVNAWRRNANLPPLACRATTELYEQFESIVSRDALSRLRYIKATESADNA